MVRRISVDDICRSIESLFARGVSGHRGGCAVIVFEFVHYPQGASE